MKRDNWHLAGSTRLIYGASYHGLVAGEEDLVELACRIITICSGTIARGGKVRIHDLLSTLQCLPGLLKPSDIT